MGKFDELCKGRTMGAFFLLLLPARTALRRVAEDQASAEADLFVDRFLLINIWGRRPLTLKIHLYSVKRSVNFFRTWFGSAPRNGLELSPHLIIIKAPFSAI